MELETTSKNFIEQIIDKDIEEGHCEVVKSLRIGYNEKNCQFKVVICVYFEFESE